MLEGCIPNSLTQSGLSYEISKPLVFVMDETDWRILEALEGNCRLSYRELAKRVHLSTTAVMKRLKAMEKEGTIMHYMVIPSSAMIGTGGYMVIIHTHGRENSEELIRSIGELQETIIVGELVSSRGRSYVATGQYIGSERLQEIARFFRALEGVEDVELHQTKRLAVSKGYKMDLTNHHLLVLRSLRKDARMQVNEIASESGLTRRRVRKILQELLESGAFRFVTRVHLGLKRTTESIIRVRYDSSESGVRQFNQWIENIDNRGFFDVFSSITEPVAFCWFQCEDIQDMHRILKKIETQPFIETSTPLVIHSMHKFPWLAEYKLDEMIAGISDRAT
jgi:DNA-binding Lrp family transcriptional regulator